MKSEFTFGKFENPVFTLDKHGKQALPWYCVPGTVNSGTGGVSAAVSWMWDNPDFKGAAQQALQAVSMNKKWLGAVVQTRFWTYAVDTANNNNVIAAIRWSDVCGTFRASELDLLNNPATKFVGLGASPFGQFTINAATLDFKNHLMWQEGILTGGKVFGKSDFNAQVGLMPNGFTIAAQAFSGD